MTSAFVDSLKFALSDKYNLLDSDYVKLSSILVDGGVSEGQLAGRLVKIFHAFLSLRINFPMTESMFCGVCNDFQIGYDGSLIASELVKHQLVYTTVNQTDEVIQGGIEYSLLDEMSDTVTVIRAEDRFITLYTYFKELIEACPVVEGLDSGFDLPIFLKEAILKAGELLKQYKIWIQKESYVVDGSRATLGLVFSNTSDYSLSDGSARDVAGRYFGDVGYILDFDVYKEGKSEIYLSMDIDPEGFYGNMLGDLIFKFIEDLELNG